LSRRKIITQYAAVPFAVKNGEPRVMLVTTRGKGRWIIPKGWPEKELAPYDCAAKEAYEEAGVLGKIDQRPLGSYRYEKRVGSQGRATFEVKAYLLEVERQLRDWPEKGQRRTRWMAPARAAKLVDEDGLVQLLLSIDTSHARRKRLGLVWAGGALNRVAAPLRALSRFARAWRRPRRRRQE
jgi:8-oxo-dGTP pyrophosphatase MutT (NUDIX family)